MIWVTKSLWHSILVTDGVRCVLLEMKHRAQGALVENGLFTKDLQKSLESRFEAMLAQRGS
jgi:hypothetical protein